MFLVLYSKFAAQSIKASIMPLRPYYSGLNLIILSRNLSFFKLAVPPAQWVETTCLNESLNSAWD